MSKINEAKGMLDVVRQMSKSEQAAFVEQVMAMMQETNKDHTCHGLVVQNPATIPDCPHCAAKAGLKQVVRNGKKANGAQRYHCKLCGKNFVSTTGTAFAWCKKDADTWKKYICLTISGATLRECEKECGISHQTAHDWRHKLLHVFETHMESTNMSGAVEVDEMLIPISYKGNHVRGSFGVRKNEKGAINDMPRRAYKRGTDNISRSAKDKACVFCMVEDGNKSFFAAVPGVGFMSEAMLNATVGKHVNKDTSTMLADEYKITKKYFEDNGYNHVILKSNTSDNPHDHKPEVKEGLHIQHVNAMHHHIRTFLKPYCGVSSKYLSHYIALFVWLKSIGATNKQRKTVNKVSVARAATPDCYIPSCQLRSRPAVPQCA